MPPLEVHIAIEAVAIEAECHACGTAGHLTSEVGDVMQRLADFAVVHVDPHVRRAHLVGVGDLGRVDLGWHDWD